MSKFLDYLQAIKSKINYINPGTPVRVIMGNDSCDLDSMVATLTLAHYYSKEFNKLLVIPMLNKTKALFPVRVENVFICNKYNIPVDSLIFRDTLSLETLQNKCDLSVTLVDHHVLASNDLFLKKSIVEVIDHRPIDSSEVYDKSVRKEIEIVGSCCSLIARRINVSNETSTILAGMLYDVITFDTIGYKDAAGKVKPLDTEMAQRLEMVLGIPANNEQRAARFSELWAAHRNISELTSEQLLYKDLKVLGTIHIPGLPMLVKNYLNRIDAFQAIDQYAITNNAAAILMMGLEPDGDTVKRDLALYTLDDEMAKKIDDTLLQQFKVERQSSTIKHLFIYNQLNPILSRKQLIPLLKGIFNS